MGWKDTDLNLGLSLNGLSGREVDDREGEEEGGGTQRRDGRRVGRILTARDFTKLVSSMVMRGSDRDHLRRDVRPSTDGDGDSVQEVSSIPSNQVVGWPPIRSYRMNSLANQSRAVTEEDGDNNINHDVCGEMSKAKRRGEERGGTKHSKSMFVKVNVDGIPIGRKVDLKNHTCYETLADALEDMFRNPNANGSIFSGLERDDCRGKQPSKLLDSNSEFVLTYEDRDGDWMLIGDVPWDMFLSTVRRLRIMRTSDVSGLGTTRSQEEDQGAKRSTNIPVNFVRGCCSIRKK